MTSKSDVIVLIGPMGVGKTTVGRKLAKALKVPFIDSDSMVVQQHGPIPAIFKDLGEPIFREFEEAAVKTSIAAPGVVATGGGAVMSPKTQAALKQTTVVYLSTNGKHIGSRLRGGTRPLVKNGVADWKRIYEERKPIYEATADYIIDTSDQSLSATVAEIRKRLNI